MINRECCATDLIWARPPGRVDKSRFLSAGAQCICLVGRVGRHFGRLGRTLVAPGRARLNWAHFSSLARAIIGRVSAVGARHRRHTSRGPGAPGARATWRPRPPSGRHVRAGLSGRRPGANKQQAPDTVGARAPAAKTRPWRQDSASVMLRARPAVRDRRAGGASCARSPAASHDGAAAPTVCVGEPENLAQNSAPPPALSGCRRCATRAGRPPTGDSARRPIEKLPATGQLRPARRQVGPRPADVIDRRPRLMCASGGRKLNSGAGRPPGAANNIK